LSPATIFDFSFLNYTQYEPSRVDWGCGNLTYTPNFWTDPDDFRKDLVTISETDYEQENGLRFKVNSPTHEFFGVYKFVITIDSNILSLEKIYNFTVEIRIIPCYVNAIDF